MKILIVSFYYTPEIGAAPSRITNMAQGLKSNGAEVDVLTCLPNYPKGRIFKNYRHRLFKKEQINNINVYRYWTFATISKNPLLRAWSMFSFALSMWIFCFKRSLILSYDRVIIQSPPLLVAFSGMLLFKKLYKKPVIINISDLWPISAVELGAMKEGSLIHKTFAYMEKYIYHNTDGILGQSNEILHHIKDFESSKKMFLYRNLQHYQTMQIKKKRNKNLKVVYAGLIGVAQDLLSIIKNIDFNAMQVELHIYGGGNQIKEIETEIKNNPMIIYHGYISKDEITTELQKYDVALIPLARNIKGAVPSKIFDTVAIGVPILFCGGGEGKEIVREYDLGLTSTVGDYNQLKDNIITFKQMSNMEYERLVSNCFKASRGDFNFDKQLQLFMNFLSQEF